MSSLAFFSAKFVRPQEWLSQMTLLLLAAAGGLCLGTTGIPAGFMSGAMLLVAAAALFGPFGGLKLIPMSANLRAIAIVLSGVSMGSGVTPQTLALIGHYPLSLILMLACVLTVTAVSARMLAFLPGYSLKTAVFASIPGSLTYVLAYAAQAKADVSKVAAIQSFRIVFLMALLPIIIAQTGITIAAPQTVSMSMVFAPILVFGGFGVGHLFERYKIGRQGLGLFYGATLVSATLHGFDIVPGRLPVWWQAVSQILVGAWVGGRFIGMSLESLRKSFFVSALTLMATLLVAASFAGTTAWLLNFGFAKVLLAFAPGGIEAITMLSYALDLDPLYVGAHHIVRLFAISFCLPFAFRLLAQGHECSQELGQDQEQAQAASCQSSGVSAPLL